MSDQTTRLPAGDQLKQDMAREVMADALNANADKIVATATGRALLAMAQAHSALDEINAIHGMTDSDLMPTELPRLYSIARACSLLQVMPDQLRAIMRATTTSFAMRIDDTGYLSGDGLLACHHFLTESRKAEAQ